MLLVWAVFGKLDIIVSAEGRLVPQSYVKIVQPADGGIIQDILVKEGQLVAPGQVLIRMDAKEARADEATLHMQLALKALQLRRIAAELAGTPLMRQAADPADLFADVAAQYKERRRAYTDALAAAGETLQKNRHDFESGKDVLNKLREVTPLLKQQAEAYTDMGKEGYVPRLTMQDKQRDYIEKANDLKAQEATLGSLQAAQEAAAKELAQVTSKYRSDLQNEAIQAQGEYRKLQQDEIKQVHKTGLLDLRALQAGIVKDLAAHTIGTVVSPGSVLLSLVPENEALMAEVMVNNDDVGFVYPQQKVKLKLAPYPFQKYGMVDAVITTLSADATEPPSQPETTRSTQPPHAQQALTYKALLTLNTQQLQAQHHNYKLTPGMQVTAEISEGKRSVMDYLLSPVQTTLQESGRER